MSNEQPASEMCPNLPGDSGYDPDAVTFATPDVESPNDWVEITDSHPGQLLFMFFLEVLKCEAIKNNSFSIITIKQRN